MSGKVAIRVVKHKRLSEITDEWDRLAPIRYRQIMDGQDLTFWHVLLPTIIAAVLLRSPDAILDAGCGVGVLTDKLRDVAPRIVGVDPSKESIRIAREKFQRDGLEFHSSSIEEYAGGLGREEQFGVVVANMVMMDVMDLESFLIAVSQKLAPGGEFIFSVTHPCFWPAYYGYESEEWFKYDSELIVEAPFRISSEKIDLQSTHIHRPLADYVTELSKQNFAIRSLQEVRPPPDIERQYPKPWKFPRYIVGRCQSLCLTDQQLGSTARG
jgi:SAM-dependent methyltransferase